MRWGRLLLQILGIYLSLLPLAQASVYSVLAGQAPRDGIFYLPFGWHTTEREYQGNTRPPDFRSFQFIGGVYHSVFAMTFVNSFGDQVWSVGLSRDVFTFKRFKLGYGIGLLYGYHGNLADINGIPLRRTFLFEYNLNPALALIANFDVAPHLQLMSIIEPLVVAVGMKITWGHA